MLISKTAKITIAPANKQYYENLGYGLLKYRDIIEVDVNHLQPGSNALIECTCDYCEKPYIIHYNDYYKSIHGIVNKYCCYNCRSKKIAESNLIRYGVKSTNSIPEIREKQIKTNYEKYGVSNPLENEDIKKQIKETCMKKYGTENPAASEIVKEKIRNTNMSRYGYEYITQVPDVQIKMKETLNKNYGVDCPFKSKEIQEKIKNTFLARYGVDNVMKDENIKNKICDIIKEKYGVDNILKSPYFREKISQTMYKNQTVYTSTQQRYIAHLYRLPLNYPICYWNVDMFDTDSNMVLEIDGGGHNIAVKTQQMTQDEFEQKEREREIVIRRAGYKICRIKSEKDNYPSDTILLQMLSDAKQYFSDYPEHSWINFDIDNNLVRNAEHKDGIPYFYGELRKIKKSDLESA